MITELLLYLIGQLLNLLAFLLPTWQIWPQTLTDGLTFFAQKLSLLNFILPMDTLMTALIFFISFEVAYFGAKIIIKILNYLRGTGSGLDI